MNGSSTFDEQEVETGIDTDKHTTDLKLVFDLMSGNKFQGAVVKMDILVEAKQHRNTSAYDSDWTELQTETYIFSNGVSQNVVKAVNADVPEKLQLMTANGVAKAFAPTKNMVIPATVDGSAVTGIVDEAYKGETVIETVEIPASVTTIGSSAFEDCTNLNTLTLNEGLQTIKTAAFKNTALTTVSIPSTVNVTEDNKLDIFDDGTEIVFPEYPEDTNQYTIDKAKLRTLAKAKTGTITFSTTKLAEGTTGTDLSADNDSSIIGVENDDDLIIYSKNGKTYAPEDSSEMFGGNPCTYAFEATTLDLTGLATSNVTNMSSMFRNCTSLTTLDLSSFDTSNTINMNYIFSGCSNLATLNISSFNTSNVTNMSYMFSNCDNLTNINFGDNFDTSKATNMGGMFNWCKGLSILDLSSFDTSNVTNMSYMFSNCGNLTSITARTEADKTNFESSSSFPDTCTVTVKGA